MFNPQSTVSKINRGESRQVDKMFTDVFNLANDVYKLSGGTFDPTVAPLVNLWGFGHKSEPTNPDSTDVKYALAAVGMSKCRICDNELLRDDDRLEFDFSAIAKGYGVDCVAAMLHRNGATNYMVEIGGEIAVRGKNPIGRPWRIQIDAPTSNIPGDSALRTIELIDCAIATSGNYRNYRHNADGSTYGHTINPCTGYPVKTSTLSATVIAPTCVMADALATACMAMKSGDAISMIEKINNVDVILAISDSIGGFSTISTLD